MRSWDQRHVLLGLVGFVAVALGWQIATWQIARLQTFPNTWEAAGATVPRLSDLEFWRQLRVSAFRWATGLGLAITIGVPLGLAMGRNRIVHRVIDPLLTAMYPIPKASLILLFVLAFGPGDLARILAILTGAIIPVVIASYHGAAGIDQRVVWSGMGLGWRGPRLLVSVAFPAALAQILTGIRLAISISIFVLVGSELLVRGSGIGNYMFGFYEVGLNDEVWGTAIALALVGLSIDAMYVAAVRVAAPWVQGDI